MAEDAFENTLGVVNGDTTLDFTFGHGQDEECRNAISNACRKGLERLEKRRAMASAPDVNLSSGNGDVTYESLKRISLRYSCETTSCAVTVDKRR